MRKYAFILLLFSPCALWAQNLGDTIYSTINRLRLEKADTIIRFGLPDYNVFIDDTLSGMGIVHPFEIEYLLYKVNNKTYSLKFESYCNMNCDNSGTVVSKRYEIAGDSLFSWIQNRLTLIKGEEIYPYVYLLNNSNYSYYVPFKHSHEASYFVGVYTNGEDICKQFNPDALEKNIRQIPDNLNYDNNHRTMLREFYFLLKDFFENTDKKYIFPELPSSL